MNKTERNMITKFEGIYRFLSNDFKHPFEYEGKYYTSVTIAYLCTMFGNNALLCNSLRLAKSATNVIELTKGKKAFPFWNSIREEVLKDILRAKFSEPKLREELLMTGDRIILYRETATDRIYGENICDLFNRLGVDEREFHQQQKQQRGSQDSLDSQESNESKNSTKTWRHHLSSSEILPEKNLLGSLLMAVRKEKSDLEMGIPIKSETEAFETFV